MSEEMVIDACDFCISLIKLNITAITNPDSATLEKEKLFTSIKNKYKDFSLLSNEEIKKLLIPIYENKIDNDKYGRNKISN